VTTVVCCHGLAQNSRAFDFLAEALAKSGFRVVVVDVVGRGESDWLRTKTNYNYPQYIADMVTLIARVTEGSAYLSFCLCFAIGLFSYHGCGCAGKQRTRGCTGWEPQWEVRIIEFVALKRSADLLVVRADWDDDRIKAWSSHQKNG